MLLCYLFLFSLLLTGLAGDEAGFQYKYNYNAYLSVIIIT